MRRLISVVVFLCVFSASAATGLAEPKLMEEHYTVVVGDSLDSITVSFMKKNTYGTREFYEFREGIRELNPWLMKRAVQLGDVLLINYWVDA